MSAKQEDKRVTMADVRSTVKAAISVIAEEFGPRLKALESRPAFEYKGVWDGATQYDAGNFATHDGSLWHCGKSTRTEPGTSADWKLAVKRGKDGKDLRAPK